MAAVDAPAVEDAPNATTSEPSLPWKTWAGVVALVVLEYLAVSVVYDARPLRSQFGWVGWAGDAGSLGVVALTSVLLFARFPDGAARAEVKAHLTIMPRLLPWMGVHLLAVVVFFVLCDRVLGGSLASSAHPGMLVGGWVVGAVAVGGTAAGIVIPGRAVRSVARMLVRPLAVGLIGGAVAWIAGRAFEDIWPYFSRATLNSSAWLLEYFTRGSVFKDPDRLYLGMGDFVVAVSAVCSGIQGMGLMAVLTVAYLVRSRRVLRFPRAAIVVPLGILGAFVANVIRVAGLVWIGARFSPDVAMGGFHSKAGWLLTCGIALGLLSWLGRSRAFRIDAPPPPELAENPTVPYLLPVLVSLVAMLITGLGISSFDWLYPVRVAATLAVLVAVSWRRLGPFQLELSPYGIVGGAFVFLLWLLLTPAASADDVAVLQNGLGGLSRTAMVVWLAARVIGFVVVAPVSEELAFRGFLLRRLCRFDFDQVDYRAAARRPLAMIGSALAFGALHRSFVAGTVAGVVYGLTLIPRGRLVDAVAAHAVTNGLLLGYALISSDWRWVF